MPKARLTLKHLPPALREILGSERKRHGFLFILLGMVFAALVVFGVALMIGTELSNFAGIITAFAGAWIGLQAAKVWNRSSGSPVAPEVRRSAKAAISGQLPGEALALLEACAMHRQRVAAAAASLETRGGQWAEIANDARGAADRALIRALGLCAPFAGQGRGRRGRWAKAFEEVLDGDFDDVLDALSKRATDIEVDTSDLPQELSPMVKIVEDLKRLASELANQQEDRVFSEPGRSETEEILDRLRHVREAEQELHRDMRA